MRRASALRGRGGVLGSDSDGKLITYKVLIKQQNIL